MKLVFESFSRAAVRLLAIMFVVSLCTVSGACGRSKSRKPDTVPKPATVQAKHVSRSIDEIIAEVDAYQPPKGVSADTWATLNAELKRLLVARAGGGKRMSTAPTGSQDAVSDLTAMSNGAGTQATLSWTEVVPGDYNNDGVVDIIDLQPVALYYGQWTDSGPYDGHRLVVGDSAPQIGIGDLQAIANNYSAHLQGYQVWRGHWNGTGTDWEATPRPNPTPRTRIGRRIDLRRLR
jgi:hypothetical protein